MKKKENKRGTKKERQQATWKDALLEGIVEIGMYVIVVGIAFLLAILIFQRFLLASAKHALGAPFRCLR